MSNLKTDGLGSPLNIGDRVIFRSHTNAEYCFGIVHSFSAQQVRVLSKGMLIMSAVTGNDIINSTKTIPTRFVVNVENINAPGNWEVFQPIIGTLLCQKS